MIAANPKRPTARPPGLPPLLALRGLLVAAALAAAGTPSRGADPAPAPAAWTPQQKASLEALDRTIARFDALLARDDDARHQAATRSVLDALKQRRDALRTAFDQSRCDDLRAELNLAYQRQAAWMTPAREPAPAGKPSP
jgi:hypothetical protein